MFKIDNDDFEIGQAYVDSIFDDEDEKLIFGLIIEGKRVNDDVLPYINSETILKVKKHELNRWQDICGKTIEWKKKSKIKERPYVQFINFEKKQTSGYLYDTKIEFKEVDNNVCVKLIGLCDIKTRTISLKIETTLKFHGINMGGYENEAEAKCKIKPYLNADDYIYEKKKYGIKLAPKE